MKQPYDIVEMKIPAKPDYVAIARLTLSGIANRMGFSYDDIEDMKIAISEACTNAVQHAYKEEIGEITVAFGLYEEYLEIVVADKGESFDYGDLQKEAGPYETSQDVEELPEGGLGLYLIDTLMDQTKITHNKGLTLMMAKNLQREQVESDGSTISTYEAK